MENEVKPLKIMDYKTSKETNIKFDILIDSNLRKLVKDLYDE